MSNLRVTISANAGIQFVKHAQRQLVAPVFAVAVAVAVAVDVAVDVDWLLTQNSADELPFVQSRKWIRNERCLSNWRASHFLPRTDGNPKGSECGRLSFAYYFFGEAKKSK